jgi:hypothetical protein
MRICRLTILGAAALALSTLAAHAGPCSGEIDRLQVEVDAKLEATAKSGRAAPESRAARLHHQPTPGSIAAAESKLGEGRQVDEAVAALARARAADRAGDKGGCERSLADVQRLIGR